MKWGTFYSKLSRVTFLKFCRYILSFLVVVLVTTSILTTALTLLYCFQELQFSMSRDGLIVFFDQFKMFWWIYSATLLIITCYIALEKVTLKYKTDAVAANVAFYAANVQLSISNSNTNNLIKMAEFQKNLEEAKKSSILSISQVPVPNLDSPNQFEQFYISDQLDKLNDSI